MFPIKFISSFANSPASPSPLYILYPAPPPIAAQGAQVFQSFKPFPCHAFLTFAALPDTPGILKACVALAAQGIPRAVNPIPPATLPHSLFLIPAPVS